MTHTITFTVPAGKTADLSDSMGVILDDSFIDHDVIDGDPSISLSDIIFKNDVKVAQAAGDLLVHVNGYLCPSIHVLDLLLAIQQLIDKDYEFVATQNLARHDLTLPAGYENKKIDIVIMNDDISNTITAGIRNPNSNEEKKIKVGKDASINLNTNTGADCKIQIYTSDMTKTRYKVVSQRGG